MADDRQLSQDKELSLSFFYQTKSIYNKQIIIYHGVTISVLVICGSGCGGTVIVVV